MAWLWTFKFVNYCLAYPISMVVNGLLLMLIWFQRCDELQMYARVMRMNCLVDFAYTVVSAVLFPHEEIIDGYQSLLFLCLGSVCIQYIFRYFNVCRGGMSPAKFTIASSLVVSASILHGVFAFFVFLPKSETYDANRALLATKYETFSISSFVVADIGEPLTLVYLVNGMATYFILYAILLVLGIRVHLKLKCSKNAVTVRTLRLQRQLTVILGIQAIIPLLTLILPLIANCLLLLLHAPDTAVVQLTMSMIAWMPAVNGLTTITLIPRYRRAAFSCFGRIAAFRSSEVSGSKQ